MNWPTYPTACDHPAVRRYHERLANPAGPGAPGVYGVAIDVWREGEHLWRSYPMGFPPYTPIAAQAVEQWAEANLPPGTVGNWDEGTWGVPGVVNVDRWPVPTASALQGPMSLAAIADTIAAMLAIGQYPFPPGGLDTVPNGPTMVTRLHRAEGSWIVVKVAAGGVSVRALVARMGEGIGVEAPPTSGPRQRWRAELVRRPVRSGAIETELEEKAGTFTTTPDADSKTVVRLARAVCGVTGWPAQRVPGTMTWHLARAPYRLTIESVDAAAPVAVA